MTSAARSTPHWTSWPRDAKLRLLAEAKHRLWLTHARPEQLEPAGDWRVWYLRGGRGAGKTRTGAETLARWIWTHDPGEWAIVAPTFADAKLCAESRTSGLIQALGGVGAGVRTWNRSEGVIYVANGAEVYLDGADDGAKRIQGHNLRGAWCDEVGLWRDWSQAWNESLQFAIRAEPARIVATGTPKMAHPLIAHLLAAPGVEVTHMRTVDNAENLDQATLDYLLAEYGGTTLGRQELEGEFIAALEGSLLSRHDWRFYGGEWQVDGPVGTITAAAAKTLTAQHGKPELVVHSWDTTWKAKATSDFVAGQAWMTHGTERFQVGIYHERASLEDVIKAMLQLRKATGEWWPDTPQHVLIENTTWGPEAAAEVRRRIDGVHLIKARGDKVARALAASPALETGHCWLPGVKDDDPAGLGYATDTPAKVQAFVEECSLFSADMRHLHDDQVDAWSQMVNWTRRRRVQGPTRFGRPRGTLTLPRP